jgi:hypothetical protein
LLRNREKNFGPGRILWQNDPGIEKWMRFVTWNVRSLCGIGSMTTVALELGKYKLDLVAELEVRWEKGDTGRAEDCTFFYGLGNC